MTEPVWVELNDCHAFHGAILKHFGGVDGLRDAGLLASAIDRAKNLFADESPSLFELGATYAGGMIKNHPFGDGNKRCGFMAAALFLEANGLRFEVPEEEVVVRMLALAAGAITEADYALWLEQACRKLEL